MNIHICTVLSASFWLWTCWKSPFCPWCEGGNAPEHRVGWGGVYTDLLQPNAIAVWGAFQDIGALNHTNKTLLINSSTHIMVPLQNDKQFSHQEQVRGDLHFCEFEIQIWTCSRACLINVGNIFDNSSFSFLFRFDARFYSLASVVKL